MITWPTELPEYVLAQGYTETPPRLAFTNPMDAGPPSTRRRYTAAERHIRCQIHVDTDGREFFDNWFVNQLKSGSILLTHVHPVTRQPATIRLAEPSYTSLGASFLISMDLYIQP